VAATAQQLGFAMQVACSSEAAGVWKLLPAVEKVIPFSFASANLADWANLLGSVRDPDFQACINLASGREVDLMLSMSHIPTRVAAGGFSATEKVTPASGTWPSQALEAYLRPIGVRLDADAFRLALPRAAVEEAMAALPSGNGPMLLLAPSGQDGDWPTALWQALPERIRTALPGLRCRNVGAGNASAEPLLQRAAQLAASDVALASDPITIELALLCGLPLVALGRLPQTLPAREGVKGLGNPGNLAALVPDAVLTALGLG
jgi:ADP-heptose:LPS heptosyltransferase